MKQLLITLCLIFSCAVAAYSSELPLTITFPDTVDTFAVNKMRLSGYTDADTWVFVNDQPLKVYPHGSFVTRVELNDGHNLIRVRANRDSLQTVRELDIYRPPKLVMSDTSVTVIDTLYRQPLSKVMVLPDDYIRIRIKGTPGGQALFTVRDLAEEVPMTELPPEEAMGLRGIYQGVLRAGYGPRNEPLEIECKLKGPDHKTVKTILPGRVYIMPNDVPLVAKTIRDCWLHTRPDGFIPLTRLGESIRLHITAKVGSRYKIRLGPAQAGWVEDADVDLMPWGTDIPVLELSAPVLSENNHYIDLRFPVDIRVPYLLQSDTDRTRLILTLYGARQASYWVTWPEKELNLRQFSFSYPGENEVRIDIVPDVQRIWGYEAAYEGRSLHVRIFKGPEVPAENDSLFLSGWKIALDPGHGGDNEGTISPAGILEKDVNLQWAHILRDSLTAHGARVILTRVNDETVSLSERVATAKREHAHLILSLHNNATTAGGNPQGVQGASVYYFQPVNKDIAWSVYPELLSIGQQPYGRIYNAYYLTRVTEMPVLLIEGEFLSHPEAELKFKTPEFLQRISGAIVRGLRQYNQNLVGLDY